MNFSRIRSPWLWALLLTLFLTTPAFAQYDRSTNNNDLDELLSELEELLLFDDKYFYDDDLLLEDDTDSVSADQSSDYPGAPGGGYMWEEGVTRPDKGIVDGFWRKSARSGFLWQDSGYDADSNWIDYGWIPTDEAPDDYVWVAGYRGDDAVWKQGYWRAEQRDGHEWVGGYYNDDEYVSPQWLPLEDDSDYLYEAGYRADTGYWISGFRRRLVRPRYRWVSGYWSGGIYVPGYWRPANLRSHSRWSQGHTGVDGYWVLGSWQPYQRSGYIWANGYYVADIFVWGFWRPNRHRHNHMWVVGYNHNGMWHNGHWRSNRRAGYHWVPGYYSHGSYQSGSWHHGHASKVVIHKHYHRSMHRSRYHKYHVATAKAHHGPHFGRGQSQMWRKSAVHKRMIGKARPTLRSKAPYRRRGNVRRPVNRRTMVRNTVAGRKARRVTIDRSKRPSLRTQGRRSRPARNPSFVKPARRSFKPPAGSSATNPKRSRPSRTERPARRIVPNKPVRRVLPAQLNRRIVPNKPVRRTPPAQPNRRIVPNKPRRTNKPVRRASPAQPNRRIVPNTPKRRVKPATPRKPTVKRSSRRVTPSSDRPSRRTSRPQRRRN